MTFQASRQRTASSSSIARGQIGQHPPPVPGVPLTGFPDPLWLWLSPRSCASSCEHRNSGLWLSHEFRWTLTPRPTESLLFLDAALTFIILLNHKGAANIIWIVSG